LIEIESIDDDKLFSQMSQLTAVQQQHLRRSLMSRDVGRAFASRGLNSSCLGNVYLLTELIKRDQPGTKPIVVFGYVEDHEYRKYWGHFWVKCGDYNYDPATTCYWILYTETHPGDNCYFKKKEEREVVETPTRDYEFVDPPDIPPRQQKALRYIREEKIFFEGMKHDATKEEIDMLYEIWVQLEGKWLSKK